MQSSSGGDEEYDSRAESISAFLTGTGNVGNAGHVSLMPNPPPHPPPTQHHNMFDPLSNFFDPSSSSRSSLQLSNTTNPNSLLNLDMVWSNKSLRSETNCTDLGGLFTSSSSSTQQLFSPLQTRTTTPTNFPSGLHNIPQGITESAAKSSPFSASASGSGSLTGLNMDQTHNSNSNSMSMVRNPKKRSRASRRAPTTVLTTDTTNFRAMVQEFTGIPAPPFTSSPFPRTRLDLFSSPSSNFRSNTTTHLDSSPQPSYILRPFAQKLNPTTIPFVSPSTNSSSSIFEAIGSSSSTSSTTTTNIISSINNINNHSNNSNSTSINYQLPQNLLMQNPILNLQSFLQLPPKFPISNSPILETKPQSSLDIPTNDSHLKIGVLDELGLSHPGHLQSFVSSDGASPATLPMRPSDSSHPTNATSWPVGGECGKVNNFSATSASDFHRDKGQENVATTTRTEGMVESWICSSD
ncbi:VQ motif-containing protein [Melia azedarach]|uniref:VQ motif-containing protein n=1 Tax=Melia azedarach TaxID=155640 RepID=A0ACC1XW02_MELAZ|nr:VQ motif-containing protein [Melia azedarach]